MNNPIYKTHYNLLFKNYPQYEQLRQELLKLFFRKALVERGFVDCYVNLNVFLDPLYKRLDYVSDDPKSLAASKTSATVDNSTFSISVLLLSLSVVRAAYWNSIVPP